MNMKNTYKVLVLSGLMVLSGVFAGTVRAQTPTIESLLAQIQALQVQIQALQGGGQTGAGCYMFSRDLTVGSQGADVTALQNFLATKGFFSVMATGYFGPITQSAVAGWQAANGVMPAVGYFGPLSRSAYAGSCTPVVPPAPVDDPSDSDNFFGGSAEGYLDNFKQVSKYSSEEVGEGENNVVVLGVEFEAKDADQMIERVVVVFDDPTGEDDLDDFITEVSVWLNGKRLARMDVDDASHNRSNDRYTFRFIGLDGVIKRNAKAELTIAVNGIRNLNSSDRGDGWTVTIPSNGIRAASPNGIIDEYDSSAHETDFTLETFASATGIELRIAESSDNPNAQTVRVDGTRDTDDVELLVFTLEARNGDIELFELPVLFTVSSTSQDVREIANRATLVIDGDEYSELIPAEGADGDVTVLFDNLDIVIDEGDKLTVVVMVDINRQGGRYDEGTTIKADIGSTQRDAIEAEDETGSDLSTSRKKGTVTGEEQTLRVSGAILANAATSVRSIENDDSITTDNQVEFKVTFDVEAFETDLYIPKIAERGITLGTAGVNYTIEDASDGGSATTTGIVSASLTSTADSSGSYFRVRDGQTKKMTLTVVYDPALTSFYQLQLYSLNFASSMIAPTTQQRALPTENFETSATFVQN